MSLTRWISSRGGGILYKIAKNIDSRSAMTFDCTKIPDYKKLTKDNFFISVDKLDWSYNWYNGDSLTPVITYDASTGICSVGRFHSSFSSSKNAVWVYYSLLCITDNIKVEDISS